MSPAFGTSFSVAPAFAQSHRGTNWKMLGPAIGAAGVGGFLFYRGHVLGKKAEIAVRPEGAVHVGVRW